MAKADFCFTYYDGDAARDMAHMNRLERGAYTDIIISQRKFGHLTGAQITKILGRDFDECWGAIELILKKDSEEKFFIDWLDASELKAKKQAAHQSENGSKGGRGNKSQSKPNQKPEETQIKPLEDGDGIEGVIENKKDSFEEKFGIAFDEITLENFRNNFPKLDLAAELSHFMLKCNSAKNEYHTRDPDGLRLGFLTQLKNSKSFINGKSGIGIKQQQTRDTANAVIEHYSEVFKKRPDG